MIMKGLPSYKDFVNEKYSADHAEELGTDDHQWSEIDPAKHPELAKEFFELVKLAYASIGGHAKIKSPKDLFSHKNNWTFWEGIDLHGSPDIDLVTFGKHTKYGVKFSGVGHDGARESKKEYLEKKARDLSTIGFFGEVSGKLADIILAKYKVPHIRSQEEAEKLLGKEVEWHGKHPNGKSPGEGWYTRKLGGKSHTKIIVGNPAS